MCLVAVKQPYVLQILYDDDAESPREWDNFGRMVCWHSRYNLGDKHSHSKPGDFLQELVRESMKPIDVISYVKDGHSNGLIFEHDKSGDVWRLLSYSDYFKKRYEEYVVETPPGMNDEDLSDAIIECMGEGDLLMLARQKNCILKLNLYNHSMLSMSTSSFIGHAHHAEWDSGQVGWIYASHGDVKKEYGNVTPETLEKAENLLRAEVETYSCFLRNQCYGFRLYKHGAEENSCWGFIGCINDIKKDMAGHLPEECRNLLEDLEEVPDVRFDGYIDHEYEEMEVMA